MKKIELTRHINKIANHFREIVIKDITLACLIEYDKAKDNGIILHGNDYFYARDGLVVGIRYERLLLDIDDKVVCTFTEVNGGERKETGMYLIGMPMDMLLDMVQNIPSYLYK